MSAALTSQIRAGLMSGQVIPYLGPEVLKLEPDLSVPGSPELLVGQITAKVTVPHKINKNLTAASQYIENFKHRKTLVGLMSDAFQGKPAPTYLHRYLATLPKPLPLIVDVWYDATMAAALQSRADFGQIQGVSRAEHFNEWVHYYNADGSLAEPSAAEQWATILYKPLGAIAPEKNFIVSDSDYVEVLTEIDIQTPIPEIVQQLRKDRSFLFLGCRFRNQLERSFARQIMKRSSAKHWAVLVDEPTRNELRFLTEQNIEPIRIPLEEFVEQLTGNTLEQAVAAAG
jgi:hypothetical protein